MQDFEAKRINEMQNSSGPEFYGLFPGGLVRSAGGLDGDEKPGAGVSAEANQDYEQG